MFRTLVPTLLILASLAGCIEVPQMDDDIRSADAAPPPETRVECMTAEATQEDSVEPCQGSTGGQCATRILHVEGRIGVDRLPVKLESVNGGILLEPSEGDAWSFDARVHVRGETEESARKGLDEAWTWSHTDGSSHFLHAGPTPGPVNVPLPLDIPGVTPSHAQFQGAVYVLRLPTWVLVDVQAHTTNGGIDVLGFSADKVAADTTNGAITLSVRAADVEAHTTNGRVTLTLQPTGTGTVDLQTTNGRIEAVLVEGSRHGYDVSAGTTNGDVEILLQDGTVQQSEDEEASFRTRDFESRPIQTTLKAGSTNGSITIVG